MSPKDYAERLAALTPEQRALFELRRRQRGLRDAGGQGIQRRHDLSDAPLSFDQERLWIIDRMAPGLSVYNINWGVRLRGALDHDLIERSVNAVIQRHESLRTTYAEVAGRPRQVIHERMAITLAVESLRHLDLTSSEGQAALDQRLQEIADLPFDLRKGPVVRAHLVELGDADHVMVVSIHHIATDRVSFALVEKEITGNYSAFSRGEPSPFAPLPIQYADFAVWQRDFLQGETLDRLVDYWSDHLAPASLIMDLPTDRPRPPYQSFRGERYNLSYPRALHDRLKRWAQSEGASPFMLYLAATAALMHRYCHQDDVVLGIPIANRQRVETQELIGYLLNILGVYIDVSGNPTFTELLRRAREASLGAYAHQDMPMGKLVETLDPKRDASRNPVFQVSLVYLDESEPDLDLSGIEVEPLQVNNEGSRFDLTLAIWEAREGLTGFFEYSSDLFSPETMARMVDHLGALLESIAEDPHQRVGDLNLVPVFERDRFQHEWNATERPFANQPLHVSFEAFASAHPDRLALMVGDTSLSYGELNATANQIARTLVARGVRSEDRVGLALERSAAAIVGMLAILKAGAAYVPLDPDHPDERLQTLVRDTPCRFVVTHAQIARRLVGVSAILIDQDAAVMARQSTANLNVPVDPEQAAAVLYTSGSTGTPKGVVVPHRAIQRTASPNNLVEVRPEDRVAQVAALTFDASLFEIWSALTNGACLVGISREVVLSPEAFESALVKQGVTVTLLTTSLFNAVVNERPAAFSTLRMVVFGGEAADPDAVRNCRAGTGASLINVYGPTESTTFTTFYSVATVPASAHAIPIGRPLTNTTVHVLDSRLQPTPAGVVGELFIGGAGLAHGYQGRGDLTAASFRPDPFSSQPGSRLYASGDLVKMDHDGNLEFVGRRDHQVKMRGYRIELGEIEAVLLTHSGVERTVVILHEDAPGSTLLVAYIEGSASGDDLRAFLQARLPAYMVPTVFVPVDRLVLNSSGKVDRSSLPMPDGRSARAYVAPRTPTEELLVEVWKETLPVDQIGIHDDFYELGGHSLLLTQVIASVRRRMEVDIPMLRLFMSPTVAGMADALTEFEIENADPDELAAAMAELEGLSEEQIQALLDEESAAPGEGPS